MAGKQIYQLGATASLVGTDQFAIDKASNATEKVTAAQILTYIGANIGTAYIRTLLDDVDAATARATLGLTIGTNVQAWDADLDTWAGKTPPSGTVVGTSDSQTLTNKALTSPTISGGTINNNIIGGSTAAAGTFTTLTANGLIVTGATVPANGIYLSSANNVGLSANSARQVRISGIPSAVNYLGLQGAATGNRPLIFAEGSDTDIPLDIWSKGTGEIRLHTNLGVKQMQISHTDSTVNYLDATGAAAGNSPVFKSAGSNTNVGMIISSKGTGNVNFYSHDVGALQVQIGSVASAVNYINIGGAATGNNCVMSTQGSDSNIGLTVYTQGSGAYKFMTNNNGQQQFGITHTASAVNYLNVTGAATGAGPALQALGSDTNIDLNLTPKGSGVVRFGTHSALAAETVTGYITIKDSGGTSRKLAVVS